jgi:hypothetical protein
MVKLKSQSLYTDTPSIPSQEIEKVVEKRKVSYWLEKLHIQREQIRKDENRREDSANIDAGKQILDEQLVTKTDQELAQSGINENTKNTATKKEEDIQMVSDLVKMSNRSIISISSLFPWDLFPSTIDVEESRVTFKSNQFLSNQSHSVDIKDISNIFIESSPFFSTLQVVSRTFIQNDIKIGYLNKTKAKKVQGIIEGLRTFAEHNINTSDYEIDELIKKIEEFQTNSAT